MKRGTPDHPKTLALMEALQVDLAKAVGTLELLWHFTGRYAPRGDIGKWSPARIAEAVAWGGEPAKLISALLESGWIDSDKTYLLLIHDWPDHCDQTVKKWLTRNGLRFATKSGRRPDKVRPGSITPLPLPVPKPEPVPVPLPGCPDTEAAAASEPLRGRLIEAVAALAERLGQPFDWTLQEHSRTERGARMVNEQAIARASVDWVDRTLVEVLSATEKHDRDQAARVQAEQEERSADLIAAFYDEHGRDSGRKVLETMIECDRLTRDEALDLWLDSTGVDASIRPTIRSNVWRELCDAITARERNGDRSPPAWKRRAGEMSEETSTEA